MDGEHEIHVSGDNAADMAAQVLAVGWAHLGRPEHDDLHPIVCLLVAEADIPDVERVARWFDCEWSWQK